MARRSTVYGLPPDVRDELNARLVQSAFGNYDGLRDWLTGQGFEISRSSLHRYGSNLKDDFEGAMKDVRQTAELAKALVSQDDDAEGAMVDATARLVQDGLLRITLAMRQMETDPLDMAKPMAQVSKALADIGRLSLSQKKHAEQVRREERARALQEAAERVDSAAQARGLSAEDAQFWRQQVLMGM